MTEYPDEEMFNGISNFQKKYNLKVDGIMKPNGETENKLNEVLASSRKIAAGETIPSHALWENNRKENYFAQNVQNGVKQNIQNKSNNIDYSKYKLGTLNSEFESSGNPAAIGFDSTGGHSYGKYQIETRRGTMKDYLLFMKNNPKYVGYVNTLDSVGGYSGALNKSKDFERKWLELAQDENFNQSQKDFIVEQKLNPLLNKVKELKGLNPDSRHPVVKDVLYSIAVQHGEGGGKNLLFSALGNDVENLSDEELIGKLYDERSKVDKYFQKSSPDIRKNLYNRFLKEREKALEHFK